MLGHFFQQVRVGLRGQLQCFLHLLHQLEMFIRSVVQNLGQRSLSSHAGLKVGGDPTTDKEVEIVFPLLLMEDYHHHLQTCHESPPAYLGLRSHEVDHL